MTITHLIHLSDLHIRTGNLEQSRYNEYITVFNNLFSSLKEHIVEDKTLICITGDIFHNKSKIENYGLNLFQYFISHLSKLAPLIIIPGNHDYRQDFPDEPSLLSSVLYPSDKIHYLDKTQNLTYKNLQFSTVSVSDTLIKGNTFGISSTLPSFPIDDTGEFKIALFHGSFGKTKFNANTIVDEQNSYPLEWIQHFDFALLGDIHLRQKGTFNNLLYGYSGSLIQQNFGEEPINHGYYIWDLYNKNIKAINVYNDIGFLNLSFQQDIWNIKYKGKYQDISTLIENKYFPKNPNIRINGNYSVDEFNTLDTLFKKYNIQYNLNINTVIQTTIPTFNEESLNYYDKNTWINYFQDDTIKKWITNPETLIIPDSVLTDTIKKMIPKIIEKNKSIDKELQIYNKSLDSDNFTAKSFFIKYISWDYLLCFGKNCYFDFQKGYHNIVSINGKNATGKTSFFEIICYALYGEGIPSRIKKDETYAIVNYNKPSNAVSKTSIIFLYNNIEYTIIRNYYNNGKNSLAYRNTALYQKDIDKPIKSGKTAIETWLKDNICSIQHFLSLNMITQNLDYDIFSFKPDKQIEFLDEIFKISSIKNLKNLVNECRKIYKYILDLSHTISQNNLDNSPNIDQEYYESIKNKKNQLEITLKNKNQSYNTLYIDYNKYPISLFDSDLQQQLLEIPDYDDITLDIAIYNKKKLIEEFKDIDYNTLASLYNDKIQSEFDSLTILDKPAFDNTFLKDEHKQLKDWFGFTLHKLDNDSSFYQNKITDINSKIQDLYTNKPPKHEIDIDILTLDIDSLTEFCNQNPNIPKPNKPIKLNPKKSLESLTIEKETTIKQIDEYNTVIKKNNQELSTIDLEIKNNQKLIKKLTIIQQPEKSKDDINTWFSNFSNLQKDYPKNFKKYNELKSLITQYDEYISNRDSILSKNTQIKSLLDDYNSSQYEFNPDCHICCKQPWLIHKKSLENDYNQNIKLLDDTNKQIKKLIGTKNIDNNRKKYNELSEFIQSYNTFSHEKEYYDNLKIQLDDYITYESKLSEYNTIITELQERKNEINNTLSESISKLLSLQSLKNKIESDIESHQLSIDWNIYNSHQKLLKYHYNQFQKQLKQLKSELSEYESFYEKSIMNDKYTNEYQHRIQRYYNMKKEIESYNTWKQNYDKLNHIIVSHQIIHYNNIIQNLDKKTFLQNIIHLLPIHKEKSQLLIEIQQLQKEFDDINTSFIKLNTIKESYENTQLINKQLTEFNEFISSSYNSLVTFHSKFDMFKDSIYNDHILPRFVENINNNIINASSQFSIPTLLQAEVTNNIIYWTIRKKLKDEFITIPLQKASGFQKFIISLSFRITIINNSFKQFFIDEGFVHCDYDNLNMVPEFLYTLTNQFSYSIILVSHLSNIKDNIHDSINISVKDEFSSIQF